MSKTLARLLPRGRTWVGAKFIFTPLNVRDSHWVGLVIDISRGEILVLNCASANSQMMSFSVLWIPLWRCFLRLYYRVIFSMIYQLTD